MTFKETKEKLANRKQTSPTLEHILPNSTLPLECAKLMVVEMMKVKAPKYKIQLIFMEDSHDA